VHALVLIEGIPGAGKTTASERTCALLRSRGVEARWYDELDPRHPATPRSLCKQHRQADFAELCSYVAGTPVAQRRGWSGESGMVAFWTEYAALCADLSDELKWPITVLELPSPDWRAAERRLEEAVGERFASAGARAGSRE
jgi:hypothetical protein